MEIKKVSDIAKSHGIKAMLFGMPGVGKTVMSTTTPEPLKTLILSAESGLLSIQDSSLAVSVIDSMDALQDAYAYLVANPKLYTWIILDSISEIAEVVLSDEKSNVKDMRQAYGALAERMVKLCKAFRNLVGVNVIFIAKEQKITDDFGPTTSAPMFPGARLTKELPYLFDLNICLRVKRDDETGEVKRACQCHPDEIYNTIKDRSGKLDQFEKPDWTSIYNKINGVTPKG